MNDTDNLYAAPQSEITDLSTNAGQEIVPVTRMRRFVNYLLDLVIQLGLAIMLMIPVFIFFGDAILDEIPDFVLGAIIALLYYLLFEGLFAWTPAKLITGTRVVNEDGLRPRFSQVLGRSFVRLIPFEPFSFLGGGRGWHDKWSKTYVTYIRS